MWKAVRSGHLQYFADVLLLQHHKATRSARSSTQLPSIYPDASLIWFTLLSHFCTRNLETLTAQLWRISITCYIYPDLKTYTSFPIILYSYTIATGPGSH